MFFRREVVPLELLTGGPVMKGCQGSLFDSSDWVIECIGLFDLGFSLRRGSIFLMILTLARYEGGRLTRRIEGTSNLQGNQRISI